MIDLLNKTKQTGRQGTLPLAEQPLTCTRIRRQALQQSALPWYALRSRVCKRTLFEPSCYGYKETITLHVPGNERKHEKTVRKRYVMWPFGAPWSVSFIKLTCMNATAAISYVNRPLLFWFRLGFPLSHSRVELSTLEWSGMSHRYSKSSAKCTRMTRTPRSFLVADKAVGLRIAISMPRVLWAACRNIELLKEPKAHNVVANCNGNFAKQSEFDLLQHHINLVI